MDDGLMRHGCLITAAVLFLVWTGIAEAGPPSEGASRIQATEFDIEYSVNEDAQPVKAVDLWYTFDEGQTWEHHGSDDDCVSPVRFSTAREGLCGFYVLISNQTGASGPLPSAGTEPQLWVFIDETPPITQFHDPVVDCGLSGEMVVRLRWTALDAHLAKRPIDLAYRVLPAGAWVDLARHLPNSGRYDWHLPDNLSGRLMFRVTVCDEGGHQTQAVTSAIEIDAPKVAKDEPPTIDGIKIQLPTEKVTKAPTTEDLRKARSLYRQGRRLTAEGNHEEAAERFREALKLDPGLTEALVELGASLYSLDRVEASARAYELSLMQRPDSRQAMRGIVTALLAGQRYQDAESSLRGILQRQPKNAEAWLLLGDVARYMNDDIEAREYYNKAATLQPGAQDIVRRAKERLQTMSSLSRPYAQADRRR